MNSRGSFFSVYSRFNPRASVSLGLVPEHTTLLFSFKCTVHARGGPEPSLKHNHTSPFLFSTDSTFNPKQDTTKTYKWGRAAKRLSLNTADSLALAASRSQGENQWRKGEKTWNVCGKLFQHLMEMHLLQVLRGAKRDGNKTHLECFSFSGERLSPWGYHHTHFTIEIGLFSLLYFIVSIQEGKFLIFLFDVVILL